MTNPTKRLLLVGASAFAILACVGAADADVYNFRIPGPYTFVVPASGEYQITLFGAVGGNSPHEGGLGAAVRGLTYLTSGEDLYLFVGGAGESSSNSGGGGGGGSFIFTPTALLAAAGCGGGASLTVGGPGLVTPSGGSGSGMYGGGGGGGGVYGLGGNGGGGAGVVGNGGNGLGNYSGGGGGDALDGFFGGFGYANGGGGGGGGLSGGGGFSGGGGGSGRKYYSYSHEYGYGGGGGSYLSRYVFDQQYAPYFGTGDGYVAILLTDAPPTPIPALSTWAMAVAGFAGLGWLARLRARKPKPA